MGRHHYCAAHWKGIGTSLHKMRQWERRCSFIASPELYARNQHVATSLLAVVTLWLIVRGTKKQPLVSNKNLSNPPFCCYLKITAVCKPISVSIMLGFFLISLISSGVLHHSKAPLIGHEYNTQHINILPNFVGNIMQTWRNCQLGCLEYYSLWGLACCSGHLILLLLLCGDVEVNPGPYGKGKFVMLI